MYTFNIQTEHKHPNRNVLAPLLFRPWDKKKHIWSIWNILCKWFIWFIITSVKCCVGYLTYLGMIRWWINYTSLLVREWKEPGVDVGKIDVFEEIKCLARISILYTQRMAADWLCVLKMDGRMDRQVKAWMNGLINEWTEG